MRVLCVALALILSGCVSASGASHESPEPVPSFAPVPVDGRASVVRQPVQAVSDPRWVDSQDRLPPMPSERPVVRVPESPVVIMVRDQGRVGLHGTASWYCGHGSPCTRGYGSGCYCAAAGPALRRGDWRGRIVAVSVGSRTIHVRLVDFCQCGDGTRLVDLFSTPFSRLAPLSRGVVKVTVNW